MYKYIITLFVSTLLSSNCIAMDKQKSIHTTGYASSVLFSNNDFIIPKNIGAQTCGSLSAIAGLTTAGIMVHKLLQLIDVNHNDANNANKQIIFAGLFTVSLLWTTASLIYLRTIVND